jgi:F-type H+-transporting ATPase subunit b
MQEILTTFGIDWRLLVINMINFGLLMALLWYFLYEPVLRMLEERRTKVSQGVRDAETAAARLREIEESRAQKLAAAGKEADSVMASARASASAKEREIMAQGEASAAVMLREAEAAAAELKVQALAESKQEAAKLIVLGVEKMLKEKH